MNLHSSMESISIANSLPVMQSDLFGGASLHPHSEESQSTSYLFNDYHKTLLEDVNVMDILQQCKIGSVGVLNRLNIGFCDRKTGKKLKSSKSQTGSAQRGCYQRLALSKPSGHAYLRGALTIPIMDANGVTVSAYGRRVFRQRRLESSYHLYWNPDKAPLFNLDALKQYKQLILCKDPIDALTLINAGYENVVSTIWLKNFNDLQLQSLVEANIERVDIAFDSTSSGRHAANLIAQAIGAMDIECQRLCLPGGHSIHSLAMNVHNVPKAMSRLLESAQPFNLGKEICHYE